MAKKSDERGLWSGAISFGLVNIPVRVVTAREEKDISFHLINKKDNSPIGYKQYDKKTGREVSRKDIVKGYEYEKNKYVLLGDADFLKANPKATKTIDIEDFVDLNEIEILFFEKPHYLIPTKGGEKPYVLLRDVLQKTRKTAIAKVVMHKKQRLVAIFPLKDYLMLEVLRFKTEVREAHEVDLLSKDLEHIHLSPRELKSAESLVEEMSTTWKPAKYKETYRDDLMKMINAKIKSGNTTDIDDDVSSVEETSENKKSNVIDLTELLRRSLPKSRGKGSTPEKSTGKKAPSKMTTRARA